jgi:hypothetical protein
MSSWGRQSSAELVYATKKLEYSRFNTFYLLNQRRVYSLALEREDVASVTKP